MLLIVLVGSVSGAEPFSNRVTLSDHRGDYPLGLQLAILEDPTKTLGIEEVTRSTYADKFVPSTQRIPGFGFSPSAYWVRVAIDRQTSREGLWMLEFGYAPMQWIDVYTRSENGEIQHQRGGLSVPYSQRPYPHHKHVFELNLPAGQTTELWLRVDGESSKTIPLNLYRADHFAHASSQELAMLALYTGIIIALFCYNLFVYATLRDPSYFLYVCFLALSLLFVMSTNGLVQAALPSAMADLGLVLIPFSMGAGGLFGMLFTMRFLDTRARLSGWHWLLRVGIALELLVCLLAWVANYRLSIMVGTLGALVFPLICLCIGMVAVARGNHSARYYLLAWTLLIFGVATFSLKAFGLLPSNLFTEYTMLWGSAAEAILLSVALAARMRTLKAEKEAAQKDALRDREAALETIQAYNQKLKLEVKARTQDLEIAHAQTTQHLNKVEALLNNAGEGFLSFGADLVIETGYSRECLQIFQCDTLTGKVVHWLAPNDEAQQAFLEKTLAEILNPETPEFLLDTYISLLPDHYVLGGRYCSARYKYMAEELPEQKASGDLKLMMVLQDITEQKALEQALRQERQQLEFIVYTLGHRNEFLVITQDFQVFLQQTLPQLLAEGADPGDSLTEIFRQVHTFKSLFAQVRCPQLPECLHDMESALASLREAPDPVTLAQIQQVLATQPLLSALSEAKEQLREHLGDGYFNSEREYRVPASRMAKLEAALMATPGIAASTLQLVRSLRYEPLSTLLEPHFNTAMQLAQRQGKALEPIAYQGDDPLVDGALYQELIHSLVHVFKNAVDHGVETQEERIDLGKPEQAKLSCRATLARGRLRLEVEDDGRGIDTARLRTKAHQSGLMAVDKVAALTEKEAMQLIFLDGLTSQATATESAGRGVGLAAVRQAVQRHKGTVEAFSILGRATRLFIEVPMPEAL